MELSYRKYERLTVNIIHVSGMCITPKTKSISKIVSYDEIKHGANILKCIREDMDGIKEINLSRMK